MLAIAAIGGDIIAALKNYEETGESLRGSIKISEDGTVVAVAHIGDQSILITASQQEN